MIIRAEPAGVSAVSAMIQEIAVIASGCRHRPMWTGAREKFKRKVFDLAGFDPRVRASTTKCIASRRSRTDQPPDAPARDGHEADARRCWGVTDGWKGDPLKGCNMFLRRQEPNPPVRTGLLPAQEHDSVCGKGGQRTVGLRMIQHLKLPFIQGMVTILTSRMPPSKGSIYAAIVSENSSVRLRPSES